MSDFDRLPIRFPAKYDYGSRRGYPTKAVLFHMAEGTDVARYLSSGNIARGVSVHYCIEQKTSAFGDGEIMRILGEHRISGSVNPDTIRRTNDLNGFYGVKHNRHALGTWWSNPNVALISVDVAASTHRDAPHRSRLVASRCLSSAYLSQNDIVSGRSGTASSRQPRIIPSPPGRSATPLKAKLPSPQPPERGRDATAMGTATLPSRRSAESGALTLR